MKPRVAPGRAALTGEYARAAITYWVSVFPRIRHETARWRAYAEQIPDPELRRLALESHAAKKGNVEGASAFGSFAPRGQRGIVIRAQVAFQTMFDYLDTLSEQPSENPIANGDRLNEALLAALDRGRPLADYYAHHPQSEDGGYLHALVSACREALGRLPSSAVVTPAAIGLAAGLARYQAFNLRERDGGHSELERWARAETGPGSGLRWWETVAGMSSTLGILALLTAAARSA